MNDIKLILGFSMPFAVLLVIVWIVMAGNVQMIHHLNTGISVVWWKTGGNTTYATASIELFNIAFLAACVLSVGGTLLLIAESLSSGTSGSDDSDRYSRQADLMRDITRLQDAHTSMMRSEIDRTRAHGEYRERPDIAEHEQRLRELRSRLR